MATNHCLCAGGPLAFGGMIIFSTVADVTVVVLLTTRFASLIHLKLSTTISNFITLGVTIFIAFIHRLSSRSFGLGHAFLGPTRFFVLDFLSIILINTLLLVVPGTAARPLSFISTLFATADTIYIAKLVIMSATACFAAFKRIVVVKLVRVNNLNVLAFIACFDCFFGNNIDCRARTDVDRVSCVHNVNGIMSALGSVLCIAFTIRTMTTTLVCVDVCSVPGVS